ncbi:cytochrome b/b6 domain-containing protein, partial [Streptococcus pyogenes]
MKDTAHRLSPTTVWLHWLVGVLVMTLMAVGWYMAETKTRGLYPLHKSIGLLVFVLVVVRLVWRLVQGFAPPA